MQQPAANAMMLPKVLAALSDPLRLEIVRRLDVMGPTSCRDLGLNVPLPTLSRHLNALRDAGIVRTVPNGTRRLNSLRREELEARFPGVFASIVGAAHKAAQGRAGAHEKGAPKEFMASTPSHH